jgi:FkbM family methyltransferase
MTRATTLKLAAWRAANRALRPTGYALESIDAVPRMSLRHVLENVRDLNVAPRTVFDIGAAYGDWTRQCAQVYPDARYVLVEPLVEYEQFLLSTVESLGRAGIVWGAAGPVDGNTTVHVHADLVGSSTLHEHEAGLEEEARAVPVRAVDSLARELGTAGPYLLKVDVQGAELMVLEGARAVLAETELIMLEVSFLDFFEAGASFSETVGAMATAGFALYDLSGVAYRPLDGALAQADALFARSDGPLRAEKGYAHPAERVAQTARFRKEHARRRLTDAGSPS